MDSRTVCRCSAAFRRICSRIISAFSLSTRARAFASASMRMSSFLCRSSISCSIVAIEIKQKKRNFSSRHFFKGSRRVKLGTFPHGLLFVHRLLLLAKVFFIQNLLQNETENSSVCGFVSCQEDFKLSWEILTSPVV